VAVAVPAHVRRAWLLIGATWLSAAACGTVLAVGPAPVDGGTTDAEAGTAADVIAPAVEAGPDASARPCDVPHLLCADFDDGEITKVLKEESLNGGTIGFDSAEYVSPGRSARFEVGPREAGVAGPLLSTTVAPEKPASHLELRFAVNLIAGDGSLTYAQLTMVGDLGTTILYVGGGALLARSSPVDGGFTDRPVSLAISTAAGHFSQLRVVVDGTTVRAYVDDVSSAQTDFEFAPNPKNIELSVGLVGVAGSTVDSALRVDDVVFDVGP
jgi:hypothetical protein